MLCKNEWLGALLVAMLLASCQPYEDIIDAKDDPEEASYAIGTLNGDAWEANAQFGVNAVMTLRKGKIHLVFFGIQSFSSDLYWDALGLREIPWGKGVFKIDLNKDHHPGFSVSHYVEEYDYTVVEYELDKTQPNYLKMSPMWGSADYTGELEVHLVKTWVDEYAPPTPDTLHLVVDAFRATRIK